MYKRFIYKVLIIASILLPVNAALAQEPLLLKEAAQANLWKGFGKGYKMLGDTTRAHIYSRVETAGWIASGIGIVGLAGTKVAYDLLVATIGRVSTADFYVFGGITIAGLSTIIISRIKAHNSILKPSIGMLSSVDGKATYPSIGITLNL